MDTDLPLHDGVALHLLHQQPRRHVREADVGQHLLHQRGLVVLLHHAHPRLVPAPAAGEQAAALLQPEDGGVEGHDLPVHERVVGQHLHQEGLGQAREVLAGRGPAARQVRHHEEERVAPQGPAVVFLALALGGGVQGVGEVVAAANLGKESTGTPKTMTMYVRRRG